MAKANDLNALIQRSSSTRQYFVSLPVSLQMTLHEHGAHIHTAEQLHRWVQILPGLERLR